MEYRVEVYIPPELLIRVSKLRWLRKNTAGYLYYSAIPLVTFLLCLTSPEITSSRLGNFIMGTLVGTTGTFAFLFAYKFLWFDKHAGKIAQRWRDVNVTHIFNESGVTSESKFGHSHFTWCLFTGIQKEREFWLLLAGEQDPIIFPAQSLNEESMQFIVAKVREANEYSNVS